jgi:hypothetical protein
MHNHKRIFYELGELYFAKLNRKHKKKNRNPCAPRVGKPKGCNIGFLRRGKQLEKVANVVYKDCKAAQKKIGKGSVF